LGFVAGLRTFTAPAVLWLMRHGGPAAYALGALALAEYAADLNPKAPPRTGTFGLAARVLSGGFCGWAVSAAAAFPVVAGVLIGAGGAVAGAYLGLAARTRATLLIGRVPAALLEDLVAIAAAYCTVLMLVV
jgi:uncharacterized membrane protein